MKMIIAATLLLVIIGCSEKMTWRKYYVGFPGDGVALYVYGQSTRECGVVFGWVASNGPWSGELLRTGRTKVFQSKEDAMGWVEEYCR